MKSIIFSKTVFVGTLVFNPLCYLLLSHYGWRSTYQIYAALLLLIGIATSSTYKTPSEDTVSIESSKDTDIKNGYQEIEEKEVLKLRTKIIIGVIWFTASYCKGLVYSIPFLSMVMYLHEICKFCYTISYCYYECVRYEWFMIMIMNDL
jgi:MFS family permease